jgi:hypothetical protein
VAEDSLRKTRFASNVQKKEFRRQLERKLASDAAVTKY